MLQCIPMCVKKLYFEYVGMQVIAYLLGLLTLTFILDFLFVHALYK